ncbi:MAG: Mov34/MPN/PAD-1 family protein [Candidatus Heimdallarchaeota archaeon]
MVELDVEISPLAYSKIIDWTSSNTEREIGGYLIGYVKTGKVIITEAVYATAESNPTYVSFDNMLQFQIIEELDKKGKGETIIGWFHTHPGMGCFLSGTDIATQKIYQALLPEAIAMVNDGNKFARTRDQKDYKVGFYRVDKSDKYKEISYGVITNPNELVKMLTDHVQSEDNVEKIIRSTANAITFDIKREVVSKKDLKLEVTKLKKALANTRADIKTLKTKLETNQKYLDEQVTAQTNRNRKSFTILFFLLIGTIVISLGTLIALLILLV